MPIKRCSFFKCTCKALAFIDGVEIIDDLYI